MDQAASLVKNGVLQLQNSNKTKNPRIWTPILDPQYGPQNMDPEYGPQIWTLNSVKQKVLNPAKS
jgi:hypothetical protein